MVFFCLIDQVKIPKVLTLKELQVFNLLKVRSLTIFHLVWALSFAFPVMIDSSIKKNKRVKKRVAPLFLSFQELTAVEFLSPSLQDWLY